MDIWGQPGFVAKKYFQLPQSEYHVIDAWFLLNRGSYAWHQHFLQAIYEGLADVNKCVEQNSPWDSTAPGFVLQTVELFLTEDPMVYLAALQSYLQTLHSSAETNTGEIDGTPYERIPLT